MEFKMILTESEIKKTTNFEYAVSTVFKLTKEENKTWQKMIKEHRPYIDAVNKELMPFYQHFYTYNKCGNIIKQCIKEGKIKVVKGKYRLVEAPVAGAGAAASTGDNLAAGISQAAAGAGDALSTANSSVLNLMKTVLNWAMGDGTAENAAQRIKSAVGGINQFIDEKTAPEVAKFFHALVDKSQLWAPLVGGAVPFLKMLGFDWGEVGTLYATIFSILALAEVGPEGIQKIMQWAQQKVSGLIDFEGITKQAATWWGKLCNIFPWLKKITHDSDGNPAPNAAAPAAGAAPAAKPPGASPTAPPAAGGGGVPTTPSLQTNSKKYILKQSEKYLQEQYNLSFSELRERLLRDMPEKKALKEYRRISKIVVSKTINDLKKKVNEQEKEEPVEIYDTKEKRVVKRCKTKKSARSVCSRMNMEYGATRYTVHGIAS